MTISRFHITNYRSLVDLKLDKIDTTTVFFGENNAGKSNILNALSVIFKSKPKINQQGGGYTNVQNFYEGLVPDFSNSFYKNENRQIDFQVDFLLEKGELKLPEQYLVEYLKPKAIRCTVSFSGSMRPYQGNTSIAEMLMRRVISTSISLRSKRRISVSNKTHSRNLFISSMIA